LLLAVITIVRPVVWLRLLRPLRLIGNRLETRWVRWPGVFRWRVLVAVGIQLCFRRSRIMRMAMRRILLLWVDRVSLISSVVLRCKIRRRRIVYGTSTMSTMSTMSHVRRHSATSVRIRERVSGINWRWFRSWLVRCGQLGDYRCSAPPAFSPRLRMKVFWPPLVCVEQPNLCLFFRHPRRSGWRI